MGTLLINDRCLYRDRTGIGTYLRCLLNHWPRRAGVTPVGICSTTLARFGLGPTWSTPQRTAGPVSSVLAEARTGRPIRPFPLKDLPTPPERSRLPSWPVRLAERIFARLLRDEARPRRQRYAAYFEPNNLAYPCGLHTVATMHDLSVLDGPQWHPADRVARWESALAGCVARTGQWITVSRFTRDRMVKLLGLPPERIEVIPLAARRMSAASEDRRRGNRRGDAGTRGRGETDPRPLPPDPRLPRRYFLHLGAIQPRKNLKVLLDAYAALPAEASETCGLIFAGPTGWGTPEFWRELLSHPAAASVLVTGFVSDADAAALLAGADALLAPSFYEGFGLPLLEAMSAGVPVICSTAEAFGEVAGDAATFVDPRDVDGWRSAMASAISDRSLRTRHVAAGLGRAAQFSWAITARRHAELFASLTNSLGIV